MTSPYPCDVEYGTLEEELHDIWQARSRLRSSPNISLPDCTDTFENELKQQRDAIKEQRAHNAHKSALLDALKALDDEEDDLSGYDVLAQRALDTIDSNMFGEQAIIDAFNDQLDCEYRIKDEDEALRTIEALATDIADGHY